MKLQYMINEVYSPT